MLSPSGNYSKNFTRKLRYKEKKVTLSLHSLHGLHSLQSTVRMVCVSTWPVQSGGRGGGGGASQLARDQCVVAFWKLYVFYWNDLASIECTWIMTKLFFLTCLIAHQWRSLIKAGSALSRSSRTLTFTLIHLGYCWSMLYSYYKKQFTNISGGNNYLGLLYKLTQHQTCKLAICENTRPRTWSHYNKFSCRFISERIP